MVADGPWHKGGSRVTATQEPAADLALTVAPRPADDRRARLARRLFPADAPRRVTRRGALLAVAGILAGVITSLARTGGHGPFDSIWAEDGSGLLYDALNLSTLDAVTKGLNGYFVVLARVIAEPTSAFPLTWAPAIMSTGTAVCTAVFAFGAYLASGAYLRGTALRLLVALPAVAAPVGGGVTPNNAATLQFVALYAMFWMLLWSPSSRAGRAFALTVVTLTGMSTMLAIAFVPLALLRLYLRRDRWSTVLATAVCATAAVQLVALGLGVTSREGLSRPRPDPVWAFAEWVLWGVPYSVAGETLLWWQRPGALVHVLLVGGAYLVVLAGVALAVRRVTHPAWGLAALAATHSAIVLALSMMGMGYAVETYLVPESILMGTSRYLVPSSALLIVAVIALLRPRSADPAEPASDRPAASSGQAARRRVPADAWPVVAYGLLVLVICALNLRVDGPRTKVPSWSGVVAKAEAQCEATGARQVRVRHGGEIWYPWIDIPCRKLVSDRNPVSNKNG
jgi:hypothetical protein